MTQRSTFETPCLGPPPRIRFSLDHAARSHTPREFVELHKSDLKSEKPPHEPFVTGSTALRENLGVTYHQIAASGEPVIMVPL